MTFAFETQNLDAAVRDIQAEADGRELRLAGQLRGLDSKVASDVADFLMQHAQAVFDAADGKPELAKIVCVPYKGLGIVFEQAPTRISSPTALTPAGSTPTHLACVWKYLV